MKKLFLMLMLCAPMTLFAQKFGHLDSQALLQSLPEATAVQSKLEAKGKEYQKQLEDMQAELQRQAQAYDKTKSTMNASKQQETEASLQQMYQKIQQTYQDNQQALQKAQQEKMTPITSKLVDAIKAVGKAGGYVYIMDVSAGIPYISETLSKDVTADVKSQLAKMK